MEKERSSNDDRWKLDGGQRAVVESRYMCRERGEDVVGPEEA